MARRPKAEFEITARDKAQAVLLGVDRSLRNLNRTATIGGRALGGLAIGAGLAQLVQTADRYNALSIRIRTATKDTGDFEKIQRQLIATSAATGTQLESTVDTFQALSRVREDIGATNDQLLTLTTTVQQLGVIGGTSTESLKNGLRQFNQGLAGGIFRAEEFNSIVENIPELAKRLADGFDKTQGQLRQMVIDGELLSEDVFKTLLEQAPEIAEEFENIPLTLDRAFTNLGESIGIAAATLDSSLGITGAFAKSIDGVARALRGLAGNLSDQEILQNQLDLTAAGIFQVEQNLARLAESGVAADNPTVLKLEEGLRALQLRAEGTRQTMALLAEAASTELTGSAGGAVDEAATQKALDQQLKLQRASAGHFDKLLEQESEFLVAQTELRLEGLKQLSEAVAAEQEVLQADEFARLLGFEDAKSQLLFEKDEERFLASLDGRQRRFEEELAQELGFASVRDETLAAQEEEFQRRLIEARFRNNDIARKAALDLAKFEKAVGVEKAKFLLQQAATLTQGLAGSSRAIFSLNKAAAIANAVINTAQGVTAALSIGPAGIPLAALIGAQGAVQIATIASTQFGGASSGATSFGPGTGIPSLADSPLRDIPVITSDSRNQSSIILTIRGDGDLSRVIADTLAVEVDQGDVQLFRDNSRQAIEIRGDR